MSYQSVLQSKIKKLYHHLDYMILKKGEEMLGERRRERARRKGMRRKERGTKTVGEEEEGGRLLVMDVLYQALKSILH